MKPQLKPGPAYRLKQGVRWQYSRSGSWEPVTIDFSGGFHFGTIELDGELHNVFSYLAPNVRYQKNSPMRYYAQKA